MEAAAKENAGQSPFLKPGFIAAAAFVLFLVAAGVVVAVVGTPSQPAEPLSVVPSQSASPAFACAGSQQEPIGEERGFEEIHWVAENSVVFPTSTFLGPRQTLSSGVRACFEHNSLGSILAAATAVAQLSSPTLRIAYLEHLGAFEEAAQAKRDTSDVEIRTTIDGFKLISFTDMRSVVDIALTATGKGASVYFSMLITLKWEDNDWTLIVEDNTAPVQIPDLSGFEGW